MKSLLLIPCFMWLIGCANKVEIIKDSSNGFYIIEIDSCEYIGHHIEGGDIIIHKQNCKYCAKRK